jgi:hypothetical protein
MQKPANKASEHMRKKAKVCETIAEDKTQESLTGASCDKALNEQAAKDWRLKSQVWTEAEAVVRAVPPKPTLPAK